MIVGVQKPFARVVARPGIVLSQKLLDGSNSSDGSKGKKAA